MSVYFETNNERAFGTFPLRGDAAHQAIQRAAEVGYSAFDTAQMYQNEADTGMALAATGIEREKLFITTKVHPDNFTENQFVSSVGQSLIDLKTDYVDMLLLHWPPVGGDVDQPLLLLQDCLKRGLTKNIGVSNFNLRMLRRAVEVLDAPIGTNQVEFHALLNQDALLKGASALGVSLSSYCSIARGEVFKHPVLAEVGKRYQRSAAQVALRWILQKGVSVNTMSTNPKNISSNFEVMDFTLSNVDMSLVDRLTSTQFRIVTADIVKWAPEWD